MSSLSPDDVVLSLLLALLLPNDASAEVLDDTTEPDNKSTQVQMPSSVAKVKEQALKPRRPVETPPTEYLPYPPPDNYQWPPGENPGNENPQPSEFNPPAGWYTGQSGSGSGSQSQTSAASTSLRPPTLFRLLASSLGTNARRIARPQVYPSQLDSQHPTFAPLPPSKWPPGAIPSVETPPTTTPTLPPPSWPLLSRLLISAFPVIPRNPVETPPIEFLPYPPPPNYVWPAGENPGNENPQPSEFIPPGPWYEGTGGQSGSSSSAPGTASPANNGGTTLASDSGHSPALSPGAIAGITVGGSVFLAVVTWYLWRRRKINKRKKAEGGGGPEAPMSEAD
ncbi:MAG: hypothetical protein Q9195_000370 [Heterodermia aff. obscurata]